MCIVCKDWLAGKVTNKEAMGNLGEMIGDKDMDDPTTKHYFEAYEKIFEKEFPQTVVDAELDQRWHEENHEE